MLPCLKKIEHAIKSYKLLKSKCVDFAAGECELYAKVPYWNDAAKMVRRLRRAAENPYDEESGS